MEQLKSDLTRRRILNAAESMFFTIGFEKTRTMDIAARADVSEGLVFKYFSSKEVLFIEAFRDSMETLSGDMVHYLETEEPLEWLYTFALECVYPADDTPVFVKIFSQATRLLIKHFVQWDEGQGAFEPILTGIIAKGQTLGQITDDETPERLAYAYWRFLIGSICSDIYFPGEGQENNLDVIKSLFRTHDKKDR